MINQNIKNCMSKYTHKYIILTTFTNLSSKTWVKFMDTETNIKSLAKTIKNASDDYEETTKKYNTGAFESRIKYATLVAYKHSFAIMTNTVISGGHFNQLLEKYQND